MTMERFPVPVNWNYSLFLEVAINFFDTIQAQLHTMRQAVKLSVRSLHSRNSAGNIGKCSLTAINNCDRNTVIVSFHVGGLCRRSLNPWRTTSIKPRQNYRIHETISNLRGRLLFAVKAGVIRLPPSQPPFPPAVVRWME